MAHFFQKKGFWFFLYVAFFTALAFFYHHDVIYNSYNYGRHWDWSFYTYSDQYKNYIQSFYSIRDIGLSNFDVFSVNISEFSIKFFIYALFKILTFINVPVSISIINKVTVFVLFHLFSVIGMWFLAKRILRTLYDKGSYLFFITTTLAALLYSFSMVIIFDLHGGALNRQLSAFIFPWFFLFVYDYFQTANPKKSILNLFTICIFLIFFDISNIFYFGTFMIFAIILKRSSFKTKALHILLLGLISLALNFYWIQGLVVSSNLNIQSLLEQKRTDVTVLQAYSSPHRNNLFVTSTPHDLINFVFKDNLMVYLPFLMLFVLIVRNLTYKKLKYIDKRLMLLLLGGLLMSLTLTSGTYSVGKVYELLYAVYFLSFIQGAVRYMPNLAIYLVFTYLVTANIYYKNRGESLAAKVTTTTVVMIILGFLVFNNNLISRVYLQTTKGANQDRNINNEIGALYKLDPTPLKVTSEDKLIYGILPVPSWLSPLYIDNAYPSSSQGSDTEVFFSKNLLLTSGSAGPASDFFSAFISKGFSKEFFAITNVRYLSFKNYKLINEPSIRLFYISKKFITKTFPNNLELNNAMTNNTVYKLSNKYFIPLIYSPEKLETVTKLKNLPYLLEKLGLSKSPAVIVMEQNKGAVSSNLVTQKAHLEYKKINPTKYVVRVHGAKGTVPLVLGKLFYSGWHAFVLPKSNKSDLPDLNNYRALQGNESDQATKEELRLFIKNGWISTLGDGSTKKITTITYSGINKETQSNGLNYSIDFVSKNFSNSIQNDNLPSGNVFDTILSKSYELETKDHFVINGFSNLWLFRTDQICKNVELCTKNADGSFDFDVVLEFIPQRVFALGILISVASLISVIVFISKLKNESK